MKNVLILPVNYNNYATIIKMKIKGKIGNSTSVGYGERAVYRKAVILFNIPKNAIK